jgi:hypothetical protein
MLNLAQYNNQFSWQQGSKTDTERAVSWNGNYKSEGSPSAPWSHHSHVSEAEDRPLFLTVIPQTPTASFAQLHKALICILYYNDYRLRQSNVLDWVVATLDTDCPSTDPFAFA